MTGPARGRETVPDATLVGAWTTSSEVGSPTMAKENSPPCRAAKCFDPGCPPASSAISRRRRSRPAGARSVPAVDEAPRTSPPWCPWCPRPRAMDAAFGNRAPKGSTVISPHAHGVEVRREKKSPVSRLLREIEPMTFGRRAAPSSNSNPARNPLSRSATMAGAIPLAPWWHPAPAHCRD